MDHSKNNKIHKNGRNLIEMFLFYLIVKTWIQLINILNIKQMDLVRNCTTFLKYETHCKKFVQILFGGSMFNVTSLV